jgi:hypothetical protein
MAGKSKKFQETFREFKLMRKTIRKPMTKRAEELILKKLEKLSSSEDEQITILENSIMNSWQGIYPFKDDNFEGAQEWMRKYFK